uniref:Uncharacterized protein n=1 Tax=Arundo donax TaxID=35708 RepID=A0A0A8Y4T3_ARUDO
MNWWVIDFLHQVLTQALFRKGKKTHNFTCTKALVTECINQALLVLLRKHSNSLT